MLSLALGRPSPALPSVHHCPVFAVTHSPGLPPLPQAASCFLLWCPCLSTSGLLGCGERFLRPGQLQEGIPESASTCIEVGTSRWIRQVLQAPCLSPPNRRGCACGVHRREGSHPRTPGGAWIDFWNWKPRSPRWSSRECEVPWGSHWGTAQMAETGPPFCPTAWFTLGSAAVWKRPWCREGEQGRVLQCPH